MESSSADMASTLIVLGIIVVLFLLFREVVCWYWKINRRLEMLTEIRDLLKAQQRVYIHTGHQEDGQPIRVDPSID
jgi:hypothetical protein